jgi:hypothetical protein
VKRGEERREGAGSVEWREGQMKEGEQERQGWEGKGKV